MKTVKNVSVPVRGLFNLTQMGKGIERVHVQVSVPIRGLFNLTLWNC